MFFINTNSGKEPVQLGKKISVSLHPPQDQT